MPLIKAKFMVYAAGSAWRAGSSRWLTSVSSGWDSGDRRQDGREGAGDWRLAGEGGSAERLDINPSTPRSRMRKHGIRGAWPPPSEEARALGVARPRQKKEKPRNES